MLRDEPKPIAEMVHDTPAKLVDLITKCIRKNPDDRYQRMRAVYEELKEIEGRFTLLPQPRR